MSFIDYRDKYHSPLINSARFSRTYQDSNIFGNKTINDQTLTPEAQKLLNRQLRVRETPTYQSQIFLRNPDQEDALKEQMDSLRQKQKKFEPNYRYKTPLERRVNEFYGDYKPEKVNERQLNQEQNINTPLTRKEKEMSSSYFEQNNKQKFSRSQEPVYTYNQSDNRYFLHWWDNISSVKYQNLNKQEIQDNQNTIPVPKNYAHSKKLKNLESVHFDNYSTNFSSKSPKMNKNRNLQKEQNSPKIKIQQKLQETQELTQKINQRRAKFTEIQKDFADVQNQDIRRKDHNYSDLFEMKHSPSKKLLNRSRRPLSKILADDNYSNKNQIGRLDRCLSSGSIQQPVQIALSRKMSELNTSLDNFFSQNDFLNSNIHNLKKSTTNQIIIPDSEQQNFCVGSSKKNNKLQDAPTFNFEIQGLSNNYDIDKLKRQCLQDGFHVIEVLKEHNTLTNIDTGKGNIKLRIKNDKDIEKFKKKLEIYGLNLKPVLKDFKLRSNYTGLSNLKWNDENLQIEEKRLNTWNKLGPKYAKMKELESKGQNFGNPSNLGQWSEEWKLNQLRSLDPRDEFSKRQQIERLLWTTRIKQNDKRSNNPQKYKPLFGESMIQSKLMSIRKHR